MQPPEGLKCTTKRYLVSDFTHFIPMSAAGVQQLVVSLLYLQRDTKVTFTSLLGLFTGACNQQTSSAECHTRVLQFEGVASGLREEACHTGECGMPNTSTNESLWAYAI